LVVYVYSDSRSGETPKKVLGGSSGQLVVDAYTGYNHVTKPDGRERGGCNAHGRRGLFDVRKDVPDMHEALDLILDVYKVEHEAREHNIVGTQKHSELRRERSKPAMDKLHAWLTAQQALLLPQSTAGKAVAYMLNQWQPLTLFLGNPRIPVDNNASERALRVVARGRDAYLFVGNDDCGKNLAVLMTLAHTAAACGKNAEHYLADVLVRILDHPVNRLHELLPQNWVAPTASG
jgi:transposase